ncbi:MAG: methionyl-tRNA formyltransferase [Pseudomonas sp.]|nr:methionyl-tRNA formyltransferase [Pseudomonas sp.]
MSNYLVATIKDWNIEEFQKQVKDLPGNWKLITKKSELDVDFLKDFNPEYIFFPHWSWIVPTEVLENWNCVCFHMTDVPYGRGGSPLQNLIVRGHKETKLTALKMVDKLDAGDVYLKEKLSLDGSAQDIFNRMAPLVYKMAIQIISKKIVPQPQTGEITEFDRRKPEQSLIPELDSIDKLYDYIRMLDAESYPKAYIKHGNFNIEFSDASIKNGKLEAKVAFSKESNQ